MLAVAALRLEQEPVERRAAGRDRVRRLVVGEAVLQVAVRRPRRTRTASGTRASAASRAATCAAYGEAPQRLVAVVGAHERLERGERRAPPRPSGSNGGKRTCARSRSLRSSRLSDGWAAASPAPSRPGGSGASVSVGITRSRSRDCRRVGAGRRLRELRPGSAAARTPWPCRSRRRGTGCPSATCPARPTGRTGRPVSSTLERRPRRDHACWSRSAAASPGASARQAGRASQPFAQVEARVGLRRAGRMPVSTHVSPSKSSRSATFQYDGRRASTRSTSAPSRGHVIGAVAVAPVEAERLVRSEALGERLVVEPRVAPRWPRTRAGARRPAPAPASPRCRALAAAAAARARGSRRSARSARCRARPARSRRARRPARRRARAAARATGTGSRGRLPRGQNASSAASTHSSAPSSCSVRLGHGSAPR